jgi:hypothetical protein
MRSSIGRIVSNFVISLDGVVESPHEWHFPYFDDAMGATSTREWRTPARS